MSVLTLILYCRHTPLSAARALPVARNKRGWKLGHKIKGLWLGLLLSKSITSVVYWGYGIRGLKARLFLGLEVLDLRM